MVLVIFGISFFIGGVIGAIIGCRKRINSIVDYQMDHLYPVIKPDGEVRFTPFNILSTREG